jgi:hypothetical protein
VCYGQVDAVLADDAEQAKVVRIGQQLIFELVEQVARAGEICIECAPIARRQRDNLTDRDLLDWLALI